MALTDTAIKNAKPMSKPYKLTDEKGLHLLVRPSGGLLSRMANWTMIYVSVNLLIGLVTQYVAAEIGTAFLQNVCMRRV